LNFQDFVKAALRHPRVRSHCVCHVSPSPILAAHPRPQNIMHPRFAPGVPNLVRRRHGKPASDHADFLFFLSSSTSVNSASPTSSFLPPVPSPPSAPPPAAPVSCACLYIASPS